MEQNNSLAEYLLGGPQLVYGRTWRDLEARMNPLISPTDAKWIQAYQEIDKLLHSDQTISQILAAHFTAEEVRLFVRSDRPDVKAMQDENTERYEALLERRFRHVARDLTSKLTMMYFGLPVAPEDFHLGLLLDTWEERKPEDPRFDVKPPLHFLTAHKERNYGDDNLRGEEDAVGPLPVPVPESTLLCLRGGDGDSDAASLDLEGLEDLDDLGNPDPLEDLEDLDKFEDLDLTDNDAMVRHDTRTSVDYAPETEVSMRHLDPDPQGWVQLYGYQGQVPFVPGNWTTFAVALRRLLALLPGDKARFSMVHYDTPSVRTVDEIFDSLPLTEKSPAMAYISEHFERDWSLHKESSAFFVKLEKEDTPIVWQPTPGQHSEPDVIQIKCAIPDAPDKANPPSSRCYVSFPRRSQPKPASDGIRAWGANQYSPYFRTALEVLLGPMAAGRYHHALSRLCVPSAHPNLVPCMYGLANISPRLLETLFGLKPGDQVELDHSPIPGSDIAFVLPGYFPAGDLSGDTVAKGQGSAPNSSRASHGSFPTAATVIRSMVKRFLGDDADQVQQVRILAGSPVLGPSTRFDFDSHSLPMSDTAEDKSQDELDSILERLSAQHGRVLLLYPEWKDTETFIYEAWTGQAPQEAVRLPMPPLASSVRDFRECVAELLKLTVDVSHPFRCLDLAACHISIQGVMPSSETKSLDAAIDLPCFFVEPHTTDDEWLSIRAMIPTRGTKVNVLGDGEWDWSSQASRGNNIWGPRYGHVAAQSRKRSEHAARQQEFSTPQKQQGAKEIQKVYTPNVPPGEAKKKNKVSFELPKDKEAGLPELPGRTASNQAVWRGINSRASASDVRRKAWTSQPSIFDGHDMRSWPANSGFRIPDTAPPIEHILRISENVPMVTKAVMTPTEQLELQRRFYEMKNLILGRVSKCAYAECHFTYRHGEDHLLAHHLRTTHVASKCIWCDDPLFEHWTEQQRLAHLRHAHRDQLMEAIGATRGTIIDRSGQGQCLIPLKRVSRQHVGQGVAMVPRISAHAPFSAAPKLRPVAQQFCNLCGRDCNQFSSDDERSYHDRYCRPGIYNHAKCEFCSECGGHCWLTAADAERSGMSDGSQQSCSHNRADPSGKYCQQCGFKMDTLPAEGQQRHVQSCRGYASSLGRFCCFCGITMLGEETSADCEANAEHMRQCYSQLLVGRRAEDGMPIGQRLMEGGKNAAPGPAAEDAQNDDAPARGRQRRRWRHRLQDSRTDELAADVEKSVSRPLADTELEPEPEPESEAELEPRPEPSFELELEPEPEPEPLRPTAKKNSAKPRNSAPKKKVVAAKKTKKVQDPPAESEPSPTALVTPKKAATSKAQNNRQTAKRGRRKAGDDKDGDFEVESGDEDDDDDYVDVIEDDNNGGPAVGRKWKRRARSPDWIKKLGPEDPDFMPKADHHCSKCFRKAPSKPHKRDRSPLGIKNEIEMHSDKARCCRIRRGLGSAENLPNRSGWIPASLLPKTLTALRKDVARKYPAYARTIYPLHEANRNGSYWRSDPNNDDNEKWWDIPWPPYRGTAPFPGWVAPDAPEDEAQAARRRQDFRLKPVRDPTYRYQTDEEVDEDANNVVPEEDSTSAGSKRKRARSDQPQTEKTAPAAGDAAAGSIAAPDAGEEERPVKKTKRAIKPKKAPVKKAPVKKAPVKKAPVKKAPVKKAPLKKAPLKKAPVKGRKTGRK